MNIEYYVVLPGLISAEMTARDWSEQAISKLNQNILPKDVQCFEFEEEARAYIQATAVEPGHAHCLLTLSMDIGKDVLLTAINGVKRFYAISSLQVVPISAAEVSAIYGVKGIYPEAGQQLAKVWPKALAQACTPMRDACASPSLSDASTLSSSLATSSSRKRFEDYDVIDSDLPLDPCITY